MFPILEFCNNGQWQGFPGESAVSAVGRETGNRKQTVLDPPETSQWDQSVWGREEGKREVHLWSSGRITFPGAGSQLTRQSFRARWGLTRH